MVSPKHSAIHHMVSFPGSEVEGGLGRQDSVQRQVSVAQEGTLKRMASKQQQEQWDKEIPEVRIF